MTAAVTSSLGRPPAQAPVAEVAPGRRQLVADRWLVVASMTAALGLAVLNFGNFPIYSEDEGVYTMQAWSILHGQFSPYTYWYDHPFLGWVQLVPFLSVARWLHLGSTFVAGTRLASVVAVVADAGLVCLIARRLGLRRPAAGLAVALFVLSPTAQDDMRKVFLDNVATPWVLAALALALSPRRYVWHHTLAGACFAVAVLTKETAFLLAPVLLLAIAGRAEPALRRLSLVTASVSFAFVAGLYPLYALFRGELFPSAGKVSLMAALQWQFVSRRGSGSLLDPASQRYATVSRWLHHDRELIVAGIVAALILLASRRLRPIALAVLIPALWVLRPGGYLPAMYVIGVLPFLTLCVAGLADAAGRRLGPAGSRLTGRIATPGAIGLLALAVAGAGLLPAQWRRLSSQHTFTLRENVGEDAAIRWVEQNLPRSATILVDDAMWTDLAAAGWRNQWTGALWFYKLDTDPVAKQKLPDGWRDVSYLLSTATLRRDVRDQANLVECRQAMLHSSLLRRFGAGANDVEVRQVSR